MVNENNVFRYNYSAASQREVESIRKKYLPPEENKLEKLKRLDHRVQTAGMIPSLSAGIGGALVFGVALCMGLDILWGGLIGAILLSIPGVVAMLAAYPLFVKVAADTKKQLAPEILRLADEISAGMTDNRRDEPRRDEKRAV
ncbi:MAG: hypothetical protein IJX47_00840 [Clostridia bacterium]|nr:hypothetical protein [Clostridia bacterium]